VGGIAGLVHFAGDAPADGIVDALMRGVAHRGPGGAPVVVGADGARVGAVPFVAAGQPAAPAVVAVGGARAAVDARLYAGGWESVVAAFAAQGPGAFAALEGEWALALVDAAGVLWLARDPLGTRPLFYARSGARAAFASEIPPLLGLPWVSREIATDHVAEYLSFRYVHAPRTLLRDVSAVPAGHVVRIDARGVTVRRWAQPAWAAPGAPLPADRDIVASVDGALQRAVARRAAGGAGVLLSGGLDSSAILHHLRAVVARPHSFTVALRDDPADESAFAARVARHMGAEHHLVLVSSHELVDGLAACTRAMGQPLPGAAAALQWRLFDAARSHTPFVLSGDGGDEVLAGRAADQIARRLRQNRRLSALPGPLRRVAQGVAGRLGAADLAASQAGFGLERNIGGSSIFHTHDRVEILRDPGLVRPGIRRTVLEPLYQEVVTDPLNAVLHVWQRGWLAEDSLARSDRMAAKAGVEVRYPLLDGGLVAVANGLPGEAKVHPVRWKHVTKWPLREALRGHMPNGAFLERPKRSMPPLDRWLRGPGQDFLRATTERLVDDPSSLFVPSAVRRLVAEHLSGAANHGLRLWTLCLFRLWREELGV